MLNYTLKVVRKWLRENYSYLLQFILGLLVIGSYFFEFGPRKLSTWSTLRFCFDNGKCIFSRSSHSIYLESLRANFTSADLYTNILGSYNPLVPILALGLISFAVIYFLKNRIVRLSLSLLMLFIYGQVIFIIASVGMFMQLSWGGILTAILSYSWGLIISLIIVFIIYLFGLRLLKFIDYKLIGSISSKLVLGTVAGITFWLFAVTGLGLFGWLNRLILMFMLLGMLIFSNKELSSHYRKFYSKYISLDSLIRAFWFIWVIVTIFTFNMIDAYRPIPIGWDSANQYLLTVKNIVSSGHITDNISYYWELLVSSFSILLGGLPKALIANLLMGLLALMALYYAIRELLLLLGRTISDKTRLAIFATTAILYSLPMVVFITAIDIKADILMLTFSATAFGLICHGLKTHSMKIISLALLFVALSCVTKISTLYFWLAILLAACVCQILTLRQIFKLVLIGIAMLVLLYFPYTLENYQETKQINVGPLMLVRSGENTRSALFDDYIMKYHSIPSSIGGVVDMGRYSNGSNNWLRIIELPFTLTFGALVNARLTDMGFIYLYAVLLIIFFPKIALKSLRMSKYLRFLAVTTIIFTVFWTLFLYSIPWYGLPIFVILSWLITELLISNKTSSVLYVLLGFWLLLAVINRTTYLPFKGVAFDGFAYNYSAREINSSGYQKGVYGSADRIASLIETDELACTNRRPSVITFGMPYVVYLLNIKSVCYVKDDMLDVFSIISEEDSPQATLVRIKESGVKYFVINLNQANIDQTPNQALHTRADKLRRFIDSPEWRKYIAFEETGGYYLIDFTR